MRRLLPALVLMTALLAASCAAPETAREGGYAGPRLDMMGRTGLYRFSPGSRPVAGPGAEVQTRDYVLENAFVRFVVASLDHPAVGRAGCVIDATARGGHDRIRLLAPEVGGPGTRWVCDELEVEEAGGDAASAILVARGHPAGRPAVRVRTRYVLRPDADSLRVFTEIENGSDRALRDWRLGDGFYHGRTVRYVPGAGRWLAGRRTSSRWLACHGGGRAWGVAVEKLSSIEADHEWGVSRLTYGSANIPAGESASYGRRLIASPAGPEGIWRLVHGHAEPSAETSRLKLSLSDDRTGAAVAGTVHLTYLKGDSEFVVVVDREAPTVELPAGRYRIIGDAAGRPRSAAVEVNCLAGATHGLDIGLAPPARLLAAVDAVTAGYRAPSACRISVFSAARDTPPVWLGPAHPIETPLGVLLSDGVSGPPLLLAPLDEARAASYMLTVSRGPLFSADSTALEATSGERYAREFTLAQAVAPGPYRAVDFRQRTDASADCSVTPAERAFANACEGLDAAVCSDTGGGSIRDAVPPETECLMAEGVSLDLSGLGAFSVYPVDRAAVPWNEVARLGRAEAAPEQLLADLRALFPDAVIQCDEPLRARQALLAPAAAEVDAIELLTGADVDGAKRRLTLWFETLNAGGRLFATGASGSVGICGSEAVLARTFVRIPGPEGLLTEEQCATAVRDLPGRPDAVVSNGPFIEARLNGEPIGSTQVIEDGKATLAVEVRAAPWVDVRQVTVYRNGEAVEEVEVKPGGDPQRFAEELSVEVPNDCWFVVTAEGERPMMPVYFTMDGAPTPFAATNPFWIDADGDGRVTPGG